MLWWHAVKNKYQIVSSDNDEAPIKPYGKPGKLDASEAWRLSRLEYLEDDFGEPEYDKCDHCGRAIRYVAHLDPDGVKVGPDCALSLLKDEKDIDSVQKFVGRYQKKKKFVASILAMLKKEAEKNDEEAEFLEILNKLLQDKFFKNRMALSNVSYKNLAINPGLVKNIAAFSKNKKAETVLKVYSTRMLIRALIQKKSEDLKKIIESAFTDQKMTGHDKKYFFDAKGQLISEFLTDNKDLLDGVGSLNFNGMDAPTTTWITAPDA